MKLWDAQSMVVLGVNKYIKAARRSTDVPGGGLWNVYTFTIDSGNQFELCPWMTGDTKGISYRFKEGNGSWTAWSSV